MPTGNLKIWSGSEWVSISGAGAGTVWHDGAGAPGAIGENGDYYLNNTNGDVYSKAVGAWSVVGNIEGPAGAPGPAGQGVPVGGTTGQVLKKNTNGDYDTIWGTASTVGTLDDLTDVAITTPSTDQVIKYNGSSWVNATSPGGASSLTAIDSGLNPLVGVQTAGYQAIARANINIPVGPLIGTWSFDTTTTAGAGSNRMRLNNATMGSVTSLYVAEVSGEGVSSTDMAQYLSGINANDVLELRVMGSTALAAKFARFRVTSVADSGSYWTFGVAYIDHNGTIDNYDLTAISLFPHNGSSSGGGSVNQGIGIASPTGGSDGDFYQQADQTGGWLWWENVSGTWTKLGAAPASMTYKNQAKITSTDAISYGRYIEVPGNTAAATFVDSATGVTKPATNFVCSGANARTTFLGTYGAFARAQMKVLPTTGLTFSLGCGLNLVGNIITRITVNDAGTVSFTASGAVIATSPSTMLVDDYITISAIPGGVIFAHLRGDQLLGSSLYAGSWANPAYTFYYGFGYSVHGTGEFTGATFAFWE